MSSHPKKTYSIAAGQPFAKTLVSKILSDHQDKPESLAQVKILLPTRRACRIVQEAFLTESEGRALILPQIKPIGDIDEDDLSLSLIEHSDEALDIPPAIHLMRRQILLAKLITALPGFHQTFDHALVLASALGQFMDQIYTENLKFSDLKNIVPSEFAEHWQITLKFLDVLSESWPKILKEENVIDSADRRNKLILSLSQLWLKKPPQNPIIAAGTTGSIPAVAELLSVISELPQGMVVLPGLDSDIDEKSWNSLEETHPQFGFKQLLSRMNVQRTGVEDWPVKNDPGLLGKRRTLAREIMRPAETTHEWQSLNTTQKIQSGVFDNLSLLECTNEREEAETIALLMREVLETPEKTAALITPDRGLARRVSMAVKRWNITLDDSAGQTLDQTQTGSFFKLSLETCLNKLSPVSLLALLKHKDCTVTSQDKVNELELNFLRGPKPKLETLLESDNEDIKNLHDVLSPLLEFCEGKQKFQDMLKTHIEIAEQLSEKETLWHGDDGEALSKFLSELLDHAHDFPQVTAQAYSEIITHMMRSITIRPKFGTHPRLSILGQLEARLIDADLVILGGLNEGTWPPDPGHDPWMSRPMRKEFGLPVYERGVGLAAHDFVQGLCTPNVVITRALRKDGAPTIPARWLQRLYTVIEAAQLDRSQIIKAPHKNWATLLDAHENTKPVSRPEPKPPTEKRPKELSATRIETWLKDPYSIYVRYVLNLKKLDPLEQPVDAAIRGTVLHDVLDEFTKKYPEDLPENAADLLEEIAHKHLTTLGTDDSDWHFWKPRFERLSTWYTNHEKEWRASGAKPLKTEIQGSMDINGFSLSARADRIDQTPNGIAVIDYKSGGQFSKKAIRSGANPQLSLEALIATHHGFQGIQNNVSNISYWILSGRASKAGEEISINDDLPSIIENTRAGLENLIKEFNNPETPYYAVPRADNMPRFNDYEHLARIKEWSAFDEEAA